ncbi:Mannose-binding lectin superfamily protein [Arabidopsis thaliana]|jgi:hypothetical protein|uniref:Jacalin-related lectin 14 n=1 Tax=Arabidopsis thaliana TaxID=3702 RepID=JAL14_ARATH|nr:Mannose-binding lectin superfamily protein [Arabidopsis thaliana]F4I837.1 RecName: Full=Jacalin-related lectin 14 [Arabidopsis thaliana]AEE33437.1 Mannose-binding lectin superfamily protein [Arabidopsis thaliana]|eukprot:NP_176070.2 Mannose-binding lectin superfamily protein [Arabidopsis thaliana]
MERNLLSILMRRRLAERNRDAIELAAVQKMEVIGSTEGYTFDDGSDHDDVTKIFVGGGRQGIHYIEFEYVKNGQLESGVHLGVRYRGFTETFEINHLNNEHLESVEGYYDYGSGYIQGLQFKTNFRVSELIGYDEGTKFSLSVKGKRIIGFHGYMKERKIISLGGYFSWIHPRKMEAKGSKGGNQWDDGTNNDGVTKIHVRGGVEGIQYIKFDYVRKSGQHINGSIHGLSGSGFTQTFEIDHLNNEHLVCVEGYYDDESGVIQALQFKTNIKTSELLGYKKGKKFSLVDKRKKIVGFHGYADKNLNSLGAYFTTVSPTKSECYGSSKGIYWDDGVFDFIRTVYVSSNVMNVRYIKFHYYNRAVVVRQHGWNSIVEEDGEKEFELDYPNELITSVEGTMKSFSRSEIRISSLTFKTSKGRTSPTIGIASGTKFLLASKGCAVVGFYGRHDDRDLVAIGAYFSPLPPPTAEKLQAQGGNQGDSWDDGVFEGVRKLYVGQGKNCVAFLKVVYDSNTQVVIGEDHGNKTLFEVKEYELEYPSEYITAVDGCYNKVNGTEVEVITMLRIQTNKRTSIPVGCESNSSFVLKKEGYKIVGFHGKASNMINQLGVHVVPLTE